jgi:sigma-E factor negative regulatory protein RseC
MEVPCTLAVGQQIKIGISEKALLWASTMVYIVPLLLLIISASGLTALFPTMHELIVLLLSSVGALAGFWWASAFSKRPRHKHQFSPIFLGATIDHVITHKHEIPVHKL